MRIKLVLLVVILIAAILRVYRIEQIPPSLSWDEASVGYNAFTIANWGRDEWGKSFPLIFRAFEDDKHPVDIYFTALSVGLLGLSEFSTRLPAAIFGVLNVIVIFFLAKIIFDKQWVGLLAAFFMAISPYTLQFSRFNHEANFTLFFFMLALYLFLLGEKGRSLFIPFSFLSFGVSLLSYNAAKVVVPAMVLMLIALYFPKLWRVRKYFLASIAVIFLVALVIVFNPGLLGTARIKQTSIPKDRIENTNFFKKTNLEILGRIEIACGRYLAYLSPRYLFVSGDRNTKFSIQTVGTFYKIDGLFLIVGFLASLLKISKKKFILLSWAALAPIPGTIAGIEGEVPHAGRGAFMMGSWHLISALGFYTIINFSKKNYFKIGMALSGLILLGIFFKGYILEYYQNYPKKEATNWQYGMKQIVDYIKDNNSYNYVVTTDIRFQPYIFFLYYLRTPLTEFMETANLTKDIEKRKYSLVTSFDKYHFGNWNPVESYPYKGVLYVLTPSEYDGLIFKEQFVVKKIIHFPDGGSAFYMISKN